MRIVLRYDDFGPSTVAEYAEIEQALFELFFELNIPMMVGAVPLMPEDAFDPQNEQFYALAEDEERIALMQKALEHGFQLALHGYTHQVAARSVLSEFSGQAKQVQHQKISDGVRLLETCFPETKVGTFIPPWNTHDHVTVGAVQDVGIHQLSAGDDAQLREQNGVVVSPSYPIESFLAYLRLYSLDDLARLVGDGYLVITFHAYQFLESHPHYATSVEEFGQVIRELLGRGFPVVSLTADVGADEMKPAAAVRLAARFGLLVKAHTSYGRMILGFAKGAGKLLGQTVEKWIIDLSAFGLYYALRLYRRAA